MSDNQDGDQYDINNSGVENLPRSERSWKEQKKDKKEGMRRGRKEGSKKGKKAERKGGTERGRNCRNISLSL